MHKFLIITLALWVLSFSYSALGKSNDLPQRTLKINSELSSLPSQEITYTSFSGQSYTLNAYSGKYVRYALPNSWLGANGLSAQDVSQLVDSTDLLYAHMAEIVGSEPGGDGLLMIAVIDVGSHGGLAEIGSKRAEISNTILDYTKSYVARGLVPEIVIHEMAHDFDVYHGYLGYYNDWGHAWTSLLISYMQVYSRSGSLTLGPDELLNQAIQDDTGPWYAPGAGATWADCVRNGGGCEASGVKANEAWAGFVLQYARLHGPGALKRALLYLRDYKAAHAAAPSTPEAKNDLLITALATGSGANIGCETAAWRWSMTDSERASLAQGFTADPFCADADGDGYMPLQGDLDDHNPNVHPGAVEVINGIDDDCNGIIDDVLFKESGDFGNDAQTAQALTVPSHIQGHAALGDHDVFRLEAAASLQLDVEGRSPGSFHGMLMLESADGLDNNNGFTIPAGQTAKSTFTLERPGTWLITVLPDAGAEGDYEVKLARAKPLLNPVQLSISPGATAGSVHIQASVDLNRQYTAAPTHIRFWISNEGFVKILPVMPSTAFEWTVASNWVVGVRAQLMWGDIPVSPATEPLWLDPASGQVNNPHVADLVLISRAPVPLSIRNDQTLLYAFELKNLGPDAADSVQVTVTLGQGLRTTGTTMTRGAASQSGNAITFTVGALAPGESMGISVSADPSQSAGGVSTSASATTAASDPNSSNNSTTWMTTITVPPLTGSLFGLPLKPSNSPVLNVLPESGLARALAILPGANLGSIYAQPDSNNTWPTNLGDVTVTVSGIPAQVIAVVPSPDFTASTPVFLVDFALPQAAPVGIGIPVRVADSASGSSWSAPAEIKPLPGIWASEGKSTGMAIAQDADTFVAITPERPAQASQTRVRLYGTSLKSLIFSNSLVIRAKTNDGRSFVLPVDYIGIGKIMPGLDEIIVRLTPDLAGAGELTLTIDGSTDNLVSLSVQ
jgi:uncharacterized protein (TIGR03437 family)